LASVEARLERPWIEQNPQWTGRYLHPSGNQPDYGRDMSYVLADALLSANLDYAEARKSALVVRLVQYGIDVFGAARNGAVWVDAAGHNGGRKMPLLFAGHLLSDAQMLALCDSQKSLIFQEDRQTWFVTAADVGRVLRQDDGRPRQMYREEDIGTPEWGEQHISNPPLDGRNWDTAYRTIAGSATIGHILCARIMGLERQWNWPATFAYYERFWNIERANISIKANTISPFVATMWRMSSETDPLPKESGLLRKKAD
jgi:hypothetical protein